MNPIDEVMTKGYGNEVLTVTRQIGTCSLKPVSRLPLVAGRDCSAVVVDIGKRVKEFQVGDSVSARICHIELMPLCLGNRRYPSRLAGIARRVRACTSVCSGEETRYSRSC